MNQPLPPHRAAGDIVAREPPGQHHEPQTEHAKAELGPPRCRRGAGQDERYRPDKRSTNRDRLAQHAIQLESLRGDREHEKGEPPEHDAEDGGPLEPLHVAGDPRRGGERHCHEEERRLPPPYDSAHGRHDDAPGSNEPRAQQSHRAEIHYERTGGDECRRRISPGSAQGDGTLETHERAEKAADHERPVGNHAIN